MLNPASIPLTLGEVPQYLLAGLIVIFLVISLIMILVVLIQKPQGGGLSGAFGASADGAGQTAFGAKTGDVLTIVTVGVFLLFLIIAGALNLMIEPLSASPEDQVEEVAEQERPASLTPDESNRIEITPEDLMRNRDNAASESDTESDQAPTPDTPADAIETEPVEDTGGDSSEDESTNQDEPQ